MLAQKKQHIFWVIPFLLIVFGTFFRVLFPTNVSFGFDQVQILENAHKILQGDLTLIGPRTGPASIFTGPLIYYLTSPIVFVFGEIVAVYLTPLLLALITGLVLYWLVSYYVGSAEAVIIGCIWAFSPLLVNLDRVFWNPNLMILASSLLFFPLLKTKSNTITYLALATGGFLAYQAHFSGFLLVMLAGISALFMRKSWKHLIAIGSGLLMSLIPTIIFDMRNSLLNWKGLIDLFSTKNETSAVFILSDIFHNFFILIETAGKLFFFGNHLSLLLIIGGLLFAGTIRKAKDSRYLQLSLIWLCLTAFAYAFYHGEKPEYYFLLSIPALLFMTATLLRSINKKALIGLLLAFCLSATIFNINLYSHTAGLSLISILQVKQFLQQNEVKSIVYDVPSGAEFGLQYMLRDIIKQPTGEVYHIAYPNTNPFSTIVSTSNIGIWSETKATLNE